MTAGVLELAGSPAPLTAGTYTWSPFQPAVLLDLDDSWTSVNRFEDFFDVEQDVGSPDVIAVQLATPRAIVGERSVPASADPGAAIAAWKTNPDLTIVEESTSLIGGAQGRVVVIENTSGRHAGVMELGPGTLGIDSGRKLWIAGFESGGRLLVVMVGGSIAKWDAALAAAEPVLESIRLPGLASPGPS